MKNKEGSTTTLKVNNPTMTNSTDSEVDEIQDKEFKCMIIRMAKVVKQDKN
jgi:hypothetical protein